MYVDVRYKRRLLFRYDPERRLIEIKDRDGDLVTIDLTQYEERHATQHQADLEAAHRLAAISQPGSQRP